MPGGKCKIGEYQKSITKEQRKENAVKAGKRSAEVAKEKKTLRQTLEALLELSVTNPVILEQLQQSGNDGKTYKQASTIALLNKAMGGDVSALRLMADMLGEITNKQQTELTIKGTLADVLGEVDHD